MAGRKVAIIGGGVSGLSAGIFAQRSGFDSVILEKTVNLGGECTGWDRQGFHIDNSVHWLTGTSPYQDIYKVWCQVGALGPDIKTIPVDPFFAVDMPSGRKFNFHLDFSKLREEMLSFGPEDGKAIDEFISQLVAYSKMQQNADMPFDLATPRFLFRTLWSMRGVMPLHRKLAAITIEEYSRRFKSEDLRYLMNCYFPKGYYAEALVDILGYAMTGNTDLPMGGSLALCNRMEALYRSLGGQVRTNAPVSRIMVEGGKAVGAELRGGEVVNFDYVITTTPPQVLMDTMLEGRFEDAFFDSRMKDKGNFPLFSNTAVYFGCEGEAGELDHTSIIDINPVRICRRSHSHILFHHYAHEEGFAPEGSFVCQVLAMQYAADFEYWKAINDESPAKYREEKQRMAEDILARLEERYPELKGRLRILEVTTPLSFHKRCGAYKGAYMSFIRTPFAGTATHKGKIKGIENLYVSGQWTLCGGMPSAVTSGRFAVQRLCRDTKTKFVEE